MSVMTRAEAYGLIDDLTARLRDEAALRKSLEEDVAMYREMLTVALTQLHNWQVDPAGQQRYQEQILRFLRDLLTVALLAKVDHSEAA